jgi:hypothetical protein
VSSPLSIGPWRLTVEVRGIPHLAKKSEIPGFLCAALKATACAAFIKESRIKFVRPTGLNRKSGGMTHGPSAQGNREKVISSD